MGAKSMRKVMEIGEFHGEIERVEQQQNKLIDIGNGLKNDLEQMEITEDAIKDLNLPESIKTELINNIKSEEKRLEKIYQDDVESPMEGTEKELESIKENIQEIMNEAAEAKMKLDGASQIQSSAIVGSLNLGNEQLEKSRKEFEDMMNELTQKQAAQREMFSKQRAEVLRRNLNS